MNTKLLSIALAAFVAGFTNVSALIEWPTVNIRNNGVGLKADDIRICKYNEDNNEIICIDHDGDKTTISDVKVIEGSSTGTPPWLEYGDDYIGQTEGTIGYTAKVGSGAGAGRRTIYVKE